MKKTRKDSHKPSLQAINGYKYPFISKLKVIKTTQQWLLPRHCELCRAPSHDLLCQGCSDELPWIQDHCIYCALPLETQQDHKAICPECLLADNSIDKAVCGFIYDFPIDRLIHSFKQNNHILLGQYLTQLTYTKIIENYSHDTLPDTLIPTPMHRLSQLKRGFNQSDVICKYLGQRMSIDTQRLIEKTRFTRQQRGLNKKQRSKNLEGNFIITSKKIKYLKTMKHVAIVDDVITTGVTTHLLALLLKKSGVKRVDVWAIARTPKHN